MSTTETTARLAADPSLTSVAVAYYLSVEPQPEPLIPGMDRAIAVEAVETSDQDMNAERFIAPNHICAWVATAAGVV
jgi:hypothetical protein